MAALEGAMDLLEGAEDFLRVYKCLSEKVSQK